MAMALHPFVAHHHDSFTTDLNPFFLVHVGVSQQAVVSIVVPVFLFVLTLVQFFQVRLGHALGQRGLQGLDIPIILSLRRALRAGVLHAKVH